MILIKIAMTLFSDLEKKILKFLQQHKIQRRTKTILNSKNRARDITVSDFKTQYREVTINTAW